MSKKKFKMEVVFSTSVYVTVSAKDLDEARELAEEKASEEFEEDLNDGLYGSSDFTCEVQTP